MGGMETTRREFAAGLAVAALPSVALAAPSAALPPMLAERQAEIDAVKSADYSALRDTTPGSSAAKNIQATLDKFPALERYDRAFDKVFCEMRDTKVSGAPAVWYVYNMGIVVKTQKALFTVDLCHRQAERLAPLLDFALVTHNHGDHVTRPFYHAMDKVQHKTVVSNFADNYGAHFAGGLGGYTRSPKEFVMKGVRIRTSCSDHNSYLVDFTMPFEIEIDGWTLYHTGDSANVAKLEPSCRPDVWVVHPYCGVKVKDGVAKFHPGKTVVAHLQEMGHAKGRARWTYADGLRAVAACEACGGAAQMPLWGDRIV